MTLSETSKRWLEKTFGAGVYFDVSMRRHTYYRIGGPADALVKPDSIGSLVELTAWCRENRLAVRVIGNGSNILVRDGGIRGIVIDLGACAGQISVSPPGNTDIRVTAGAGVKLQRLCRFALERGLKGMNFALGIPGTVGGAIRVNAGTTAGAMADVVDSIRVLFLSGMQAVLPADQLAFGYRKMTVKDQRRIKEEGDFIILEGVFTLAPSDASLLAKEADGLLRKRRETQPVDQISSGCMFKNPVAGPPAGRLIDAAGLKATRRGGAQVSARHANFIVNRGDASAADVIGLMNQIQQRVKEKFNINLEPEIEVIGDETA